MPWQAEQLSPSVVVFARACEAAWIPVWQLVQAEVLHLRTLGPGTA
jgi:hypothetical protein